MKLLLAFSSVLCLFTAVIMLWQKQLVGLGFLLVAFIQADHARILFRQRKDKT